MTSATTGEMVMAEMVTGEMVTSEMVTDPTIAVRLVLFYQRLFEGRPSPCRFTPSCSAYALEALEQHGTGRGLVLTTRRLLRCRPFGPSGWDPVPPVPHDSAVHESVVCEKGC